MSVYAMGGKPPAKPKEQPKYKLQILKMELITSPSLTYEAKTSEAKAKNKR